MLGASFFCSRSVLRDARRIIPTIAYMLSQSNSNIRSAICEVLESNPDVVKLNSLSAQFNSLVVEPIKKVIGNDMNIYKIVVIDGLDECSSLLDASKPTVESLITTILDGVADIPLKFFILSRPENWIKIAFRCNDPSSLRTSSLNEVAKSEVQHDIEVYLRSKFSNIAKSCEYSSHWPPEEELTTLIARSDGLFIYAAAAIRYIGAAGANPQLRLTKAVQPGRPSMPPDSPIDPIDELYGIIMDEAFVRLCDEEFISRREILTLMVLLQTPLSMAGIASLLEIPTDQAKTDLSPFHAVVDIPSSSDGNVAIFHASFREFIVDPPRCWDRHRVDEFQGHHMLTVKSLRLLNKSLRRNICNSPEDMIGALPNVMDRSVIPEAVRYSCLYWASHLAVTLAEPPADVRPALEDVRTFADEHMLHWFECLSAFGELESGLKSLATAVKAISVSVQCREMFQLINSVEVLHNT